MSGWWVHDLYQNGRVVELVSWIFWVIFSICLHELAHGWAAIWQGDDTPRRLGRLTMNPLVHMGGFSLLMFALVGIAWGMMPVDPSRFRWGRRGRFVVAGAGPAMNLLLSLATLTLLVLWLMLGPQGQPAYANIAIFLWTGGMLNIVLAMFNLLPVPPLDGANVLAGLSFTFYRIMQNPQAQMVGMLLVLALFFSGCAGSVFFGTAQVASLLYVDLLGLPLGNPPLLDVMRP
jgi:Zn-dependent protease